MMESLANKVVVVANDSRHKKLGMFGRLPEQLPPLVHGVCFMRAIFTAN
jgi:hypothetical protein